MKQKLLATLLALLAIATTARAQSNVWSVRLESYGESKLAVVKVVKEELGLSLYDANALVGSAPCTLVENVTEAQAEDLAQKLRDAGATVTVQNNNGPVPSGEGWNVRLDDAGSNKTNVIKVVKEELGITLAEAKNLVDAAPRFLLENVTKAQAEAFAQKLRNAGATATVGIGINAANFPDANFRNWLRAQAYGADGILTPEEIATVTSIGVGNKSIADLTGIEHFTALTMLACNNNQLTSLDVSKNTALIQLQCHSNKLTSLNVSGCNALNELGCYGNQIQGANMQTLVESLPTVTTGNLSVFRQNDKNEITKPQVDLAKSKGWKVWAYIGSAWSEFAGAIAINEANFPDEKFRNWLLAQDYGTDEILTPAEIDTVTSINVSGKSIADLTGIEHFTALTTLYCYSNQLTSLDVSKNTALKYLDCGNNKLTALDVSKNTALKSLYCYRNQLTSLDVSGCTALTTLRCYSNSIDYEAMQALVESLPRVASGTFVVKYREESFYYTSTAGSILYEETSSSVWDSNRITESQIIIAENKGWNVKNYYRYREYNRLTSSHSYTGGSLQGGSYEDYSSGGVSDPASSSIAIDEENFPDENFRNWLLAQSYGSDSKLTAVERVQILSLDVHGQNIANLKGIEFFTELRELHCYDNQLGETAMQTLVEELLPNRMKEAGSFYAFNSANASELNAITPEQNAVANSKKWIVLDWNGGDEKAYVAGGTTVPFDVNGDGVIDPQDALKVIEEYLK
ncbi:MAG: ribosomal protein L7/L12 [Prevotella sp.]|nr:ribosomal protein L7/L12 [Prevotella sp.]